MTQDEMKQAVAQAALSYVVKNEIIGIGTGSTANFFIDALATMKDSIKGAVASSEATAIRLRAHGIEVFDLSDIASLPVYIDGADEITPTGAMIKGGGAALTREKIVASVTERFICLADSTKLVDRLGAFSLPVEVIPISRAIVAKKLAALGGTPHIRMKGDQPIITDNGCMIIDVSGLQIDDAIALEENINNIVGVVTNGLFARRGADICLLGTAEGVKTLTF